MPRTRSLGQAGTAVPRRPTRVVEDDSDEDDSNPGMYSKLSTDTMVPLVSSTPMRPGAVQVAHLEPVSRLSTIEDVDSSKENEFSPTDALGKMPPVTPARKQNRVSFAPIPSGKPTNGSAPPTLAPSHQALARLGNAGHPLTELDLNNRLPPPPQTPLAYPATPSEDLDSTIEAVRKVSLDSTSPTFRSPSKIANYLEQSSETPHQRLTIHKLVLTNFKSYAGRQEIGPFHSVSTMKKSTNHSCTNFTTVFFCSSGPQRIGKIQRY
ncbi:hypothetical protein AWJ20_1984 [Sugiyamaella lignohabitans]|uniref:Uncharacterized protein n=1 Tax=Sugiyamaella lignohabitans TaxID=796027 RepID=A0A167ERV2_9ASCO|nr:uncharacterized protein AWJ20_1984 [Sugiyamaella lignohabitans]ANB14396.1 hypothetical protein AWJ20_1984 [Sugiyamaella lignohabitans]